MNDSPLPPSDKVLSVLVDVQSAWASKINWTQIVGVCATLATLWGFPELDPKQQLAIVITIQTLQSGLTWALRTFYTSKITPSVAKKLEG
jgi:hypothetical protein